MPATADPIGPASTAVRPGGGRPHGAFLVSSVGDWIYRFTVPTLILQLTGSALSTAIAYVVEFIPFVVVGLFAGAVADRFDRRRVLVACDLVSFALAAAIAGLAVLDHPSLLLLYLGAFLLACARSFYFPAFQGFIVEVTPAAHLPQVNSRTQTVDSALAFLGPIAGTAVIAALGVPAAAFANAVSFALAALLIYQIRHVHPRMPARAGTALTSAGTLTSVGHQFVAGLRAGWSIRPVRWGTACMAVANLAGFVIESNLVYLVLHLEGLPNVVLGVLFGAHGAGAVVGAAVAPSLINRYRAGRLLAYGLGLSAMAMAIPAVVPQWWAITAGWTIEGAATSVIVVAYFTARQRVVPGHLLGPVASVSRTITYAAIPIGAVLGGFVLTEAASTRALFACAALLQAGVFLASLLSPISRIDERALVSIS